MHRARRRSSGRWFCSLALALPGAAAAQVTERVSVSSAGTQANGESYAAGFSRDGRYVLIQSSAPDLVPGDVNGFQDVFLRDRQAGTTEIVSVSSTGALGNQRASAAAISDDGRWVVFGSLASNLVPGDTNGVDDVFLRDRAGGTTVRISVGPTGTQGNALSGSPWITPDGRYVAFISGATNLLATPTSGQQVFFLDLQTGAIELVSVSTSGAISNGTATGQGSTSDDGRFVAFHTSGTNLGPPGAVPGGPHCFVRDRALHTTELVDVTVSGRVPTLPGFSPGLSADGRYVVFSSAAPNLVFGDTNGQSDVFVRDRANATTAIVSLSHTGALGNGPSLFGAISADGRHVSFKSAATNLAPGDGPSDDLFLRDRDAGTTEVVSVSSAGVPADAEVWESSLSADGRFVLFYGEMTNLVPGDTNGEDDAFVHDRHAAGFASLCEPGTSGVIACPCANPPTGPGRGCDNSAATGGASLSASGAAYLTSDTLTLGADGEPAGASSIVLQGIGFAIGGIVFGQGVRCASAPLLRLYVVSATPGGSLVVPPAGTGQAGVSARAAELGDAIQAGESRWYLVHYHDAVVLGGCPAASTWNATQTGRVTWSL